MSLLVYARLCAPRFGTLEAVSAVGSFVFPLKLSSSRVLSSVGSGLWGILIVSFHSGMPEIWLITPVYGLAAPGPKVP